MFRFLEKGIIVGLGIMIGVSFTVFTNLDYSFAHEGNHKNEYYHHEPSTCEPQCKYLAECHTEKFLIKDKEELLAIKAKLENTLKGKNEKELKSYGIMVECLEEVNRILANMGSDSNS